MDSDWQIVRKRRGGNKLGSIPYPELDDSFVAVAESATGATKKKKKKKKAQVPGDPLQVDGTAPPLTSSQISSQPPADTLVPGPPNPTPPRPTAKPSSKPPKAPVDQSPSVPSSPPTGSNTVPARSITTATDPSLDPPSWLTWLWSLIYFLLPFLKPAPKPAAAAAACSRSQPHTQTPTQVGKNTGANPDTASAPAAKPAGKPLKTGPVAAAAVAAPAATQGAAAAAATAQGSVPLTATTADSLTAGKAPQLPPKAITATTDVTSTAAALPAARPPMVEDSPKKGATDAWRRGRFWLQQLPDLFGDVVGAVAMSGDLAVCAGYDSMVQLWRWSAPSSTDGPSVLRKCKQLSGHSGKVQAVTVDAGSSVVVTGGRDSLLKTWKLTGGGSSVKEASSTYMYDAVCCMDADWTEQRLLLGCRSGAAVLWGMETGKKLQTLKGHMDEVTAAAHESSMYFTGSRDCSVKVWDIRAGTGAAVATLKGLRGRACSLAPHRTTLYVGEQSSALKAYDLRMLGPAGDREPRRVGNAPSEAGEVCPVAGLQVDVDNQVLLSVAAAWWTEDTEGYEEADDDVEMPAGCLNVFSVSGKWERYLHTVRLGSTAMLSCMAVSEGRVLLGDVLGGLAALSPAQHTGRYGEDEDGIQIVRGLTVGVDELSDEDSEDDEGEDSETD